MSSNYNDLLQKAKAAMETAGADHPVCPRKMEFKAKYHSPEACAQKPSRPARGSHDRGDTYRRLIAGGKGASMVPDAKTVTCPVGSVASLEAGGGEGVEGTGSAAANIAFEKGFDTTWIVENTSTKPVMLAWVVGGVEFSPFAPDVKAVDDPRAILSPGDWTSVPTFESFVYHVREFNDEEGEGGGPGDLVLQHRAGMIPLGSKHKNPDGKIDPEPYERRLEPQKQEAGRLPTHDRPCNVIDVGFRNEAGFPLSVYWASHLDEVPLHGFSCAERYQFHMGVKAATQDFMWDWSSKTKYEGTFIGHTFVARKADDPNVVVDSYTLRPTKIIDCPRSKRKQVVQVPATVEAGVGDGIGGTCSNGNDDRTGDGDVDGDGDRDENDENEIGGGAEIVPPGIPPRGPAAGGFAGASSS